MLSMALELMPAMAGQAVLAVRAAMEVLGAPAAMAMVVRAERADGAAMAVMLALTEYAHGQVLYTMG